MKWLKKNFQEFAIAGVWALFWLLFPEITKITKEYNLMSLYTLTLIYIFGTLFLFDIGLIFYLNHRYKEYIKFYEAYKAFENQYVQKEKQLTDKFEAIKNDLLFPLHTAISNAQGIVLLDDDKKRMENHREEYMKKYGYF